MKLNKDDYFECHACKKIVFSPCGAVIHSRSAHQQKIKVADIKQHFKVVKNPPQEIVERIKAKQVIQKKYREDKKKKTTDTGIHYKCNACDFVTKTKNNLYKHCGKYHGKSFGEIGCTETTQPTTRKGRKAKSKNQNPPLLNLMDQMPQVVDIIDAQPAEDGFVITVRLKISTAYVAAFILPTLTNR